MKLITTLTFLQCSVLAICQNTFPSTGKVGIGATTPSYPLEVKTWDNTGSAVFTGFRSHSNHLWVTRFVFDPIGNVPANYWQVRMAGENSLGLLFNRGNGVPILTLQESGNVGQGTA